MKPVAAKFLFLFVLLFPCLVCAKYVAVLETIADRPDLLTLSERQYLTDILRGQAVKVLPAEQNFTIMTRENINVMLPPGKSIEDCEGSCLAETGKNISADYVAQARVGQIGSTMFISVELYETANNKLVATFNDRALNVDDLENVIKNYAPDFFKKIKASGMADLSNLAGAGFLMAGDNKPIVSIETTPAGASLSIDGRPIPSCQQTPCDIQLEVGEHRVMAVHALYDDVDTLIKIQESGQKVALTLPPNFGTLELKPKRTYDLGRDSDFVFMVDDKSSTDSELKLLPGIHKVSVTHPCYEPVNFSAVVEREKKVTYDKPLSRLMSELSLNAEKNGVNKNVAVYVDKDSVGVTPFVGKVPVCSKVSVANKETREKVALQLKANEKIAYTHTLGDVDLSAVDLDKPIDDSWEETPAQPERVGNSTLFYVSVGISSALIVGGTVLGVIFNSKAKENYEDAKGASSGKQDRLYDEAKDNQMWRALGYGLAAVGVVGFLVSFSF